MTVGSRTSKPSEQPSWTASLNTSSSEVDRWRDAGWSDPAAAARWRLYGFGPAEALRRHQAGEHPSDADEARRAEQREVDRLDAAERVAEWAAGAVFVTETEATACRALLGHLPTSPSSEETSISAEKLMVRCFGVADSQELLPAEASRLLVELDAAGDEQPTVEVHEAGWLCSLIRTFRYLPGPDAAQLARRMIRRLDDCSLVEESTAQ